MSESERFNSVWDALSDTPEQAENLKLRADLMLLIREHVESLGVTQKEAAEQLGLTQPRLNDLLRGRLDRFSLDRLVNVLARAGKHVRIEVEDDVA
jgi:predicted XRE-type DNA-binding protein